MNPFDLKPVSRHLLNCAALHIEHGNWLNYLNTYCELWQQRSGYTLFKHKLNGICFYIVDPQGLVGFAGYNDFYSPMVTTDVLVEQLFNSVILHEDKYNEDLLFTITRHGQKFNVPTIWYTRMQEAK